MDVTERTNGKYLKILRFPKLVVESMNPKEDPVPPSSPCPNSGISVSRCQIGIHRHVQRFSVSRCASSLDKSLRLPMEQRNEPAASSAEHNGCSPSTRRIERQRWIGTEAHRVDGAGWGRKRGANGEWWLVLV